MDDPLKAITDLREEHGIAPAKLRPSVRLGQDPGVDGDDASGLLKCLHERFGTDFSALHQHWTEFFHHEGAPFRSILVALVLMIPFTGPTMWIVARSVKKHGRMSIMGT